MSLSYRADMHSRHCCTQHGCKYGDADCPVLNQEVEQQYPCEDCRDDTDSRTCQYEMAERDHRKLATFDELLAAAKSVTEEWMPGKPIRLLTISRLVIAISKTEGEN